MATTKKDTDSASVSSLVDAPKEDTAKHDVLLTVKDLVTRFFTEEGVVKAVEGVSFNIFENEILGLVGETGCGKSVTALSILQLVRAPGKIISGEIRFQGEDLLKKSEKEMRKYRGADITMIFQDPMNSLNPVLKVGDQIAEVFLLHQQDRLKKLKAKRDQEYQARVKAYNKAQVAFKNLKKQKPPSADLEETRLAMEKAKRAVPPTPTMESIALEFAEEMLEEVKIPGADQVTDRYPHELSGGMRQRVMIAMGLACRPKLLLADEPTTALDVTIEAQILYLLKELQKEFKTSILLITHDLGIIAEMCDRVAVMYSGNIVEYGDVFRLFKDPKHPYTQGLLASLPRIEKRGKKLQTIPGSVPNLIYPPSGCRFHPRCPERMEICDNVVPRYVELQPDYFVKCHLYDEKYKDSPKVNKPPVEE